MLILMDDVPDRSYALTGDLSPISNKDLQTYHYTNNHGGRKLSIAMLILLNLREAVPKNAG